MRKLNKCLSVLSISLSILFSISNSARAADFKREVIYQIVVDRFFDGSTANNNPSQSSGLYDSTKTNWRLYWGGDLAGIQQKMSYLAGMGVTAIWILPPVDNLNTNIPDGQGNPTASYHGYQARDFKRIEEHFGNTSNTWTDFDNLVTAAHQSGIKVIVDFAPNHSTTDNAGEFGALYDNGTFLGNYTSDTNGYFHHNGNISNFDDRYQLQYYALFDLADLNQENATIDAYLKAAAQQFQKDVQDFQRNQAVMTQVQSQETQTKLATQQNNLRAMQTQLQQDGQAEQQKLFTKVFEDLRSTIATVAQKNGYQLVLQKNDIAYADNSLDITQQVIKALK